MGATLYIQLLTEELRPAPEAPGGHIRVMTGADKCAVFDEKLFDALVDSTAKKLRLLRKLRKQAEEHSTLIDEAYLKSFGVPFTVQPFVKKKC